METKMSSQVQKTSFFKTKTVKMIMVGSLILVLLVPLAYIRELINERAARQQAVVHEINEKWGREVLLYGPVLKIPYKTYRKKMLTDKDTKKVYSETITEIKHAWFFPQSLSISSTINPEEKSYGIYKTAVYTCLLYTSDAADD